MNIIISIFLILASIFASAFIIYVLYQLGITTNYFKKIKIEKGDFKNALIFLLVVFGMVGVICGFTFLIPQLAKLTNIVQTNISASQKITQSKSDSIKILQYMHEDSLKQIAQERLFNKASKFDPTTAKLKMDTVVYTKGNKKFKITSITGKSIIVISGNGIPPEKWCDSIFQMMKGW